MDKIKFCLDVKKMELPYIQITDGLFKGARFMVDTGCSISILFTPAYNAVKDQFKIIEDSDRIVYGVGGNVVSKVFGSIEIFLGDKEVTAEFMITDKPAAILTEQESHHIFIDGVIGTNIMYKYHWTIDLFNQQILIDDTVSNE